MRSFTVRFSFADPKVKTQHNKQYSTINSTTRKKLWREIMFMVILKRFYAG